MKNSFFFHTTNKFLISYDVENVYTNIPLHETINSEIAIDLIYINNSNLKINKEILINYFS